MSELPERREKKHNVEDAEEIKEIFGVLNESIPKLISGLLGSVYSPESAGKLATAIGIFYAKLIEQGIPKELALEMTRGYVSALDFGKLMAIAGNESREQHETSRHGRRAKQEDEEEDEEI